MRNQSSTATVTGPRRLAAVAATFLVTLLGPAAASATHLSDGSPVSASVPWGFNEDWGWRSGEFSARRLTRQLQAAGAIMPDSLSANRFHVQWADVERRRGRYSWGRADRTYRAMRAYAAQPVMLLYNAPQWARDPEARCRSEVCAYPPRPRYDRRWRRFVRAAVSRYPGVRAIEIWNEPNLSRFWAPRADSQRYAELLRIAHDAAVTENATLPVLVGGLIPTHGGGGSIPADQFLRHVYAEAGAAAFEGIGAHPYPRHAPFTETMWRSLDALRAVRLEYGDDATPLWITEVGISTHASSGVTPDQQGDVLVALYRSIQGHDVNSFVIHRFQVGAEGGYWNQTAVVSRDLTPKPAYCELGGALGLPC
jgi:polysaccharide biosynthesis protein PslG